MAAVLQCVKHYQRNIERGDADEKRMLRCIEKLYQLPVTVQLLQDTGVGRTVNALRKGEGEVAIAARALVAKWKQMVAEEEEELERLQQAEIQYESSTVNRNDRVSENNYNKHEKSINKGQSYESHSDDNQQDDSDSSEDEDSYDKNRKRKTASEEVETRPNKMSKYNEKNESSDDDDSRSENDDSDSNNSEKNNRMQQSDADVPSNHDSDESSESDNENVPTVDTTKKSHHHHSNKDYSSSSSSGKHKSKHSREKDGRQSHTSSSDKSSSKGHSKSDRKEDSSRSSKKSSHHTSDSKHSRSESYHRSHENSDKKSSHDSSKKARDKSSKHESRDKSSSVEAGRHRDSQTKSSSHKSSSDKHGSSRERHSEKHSSKERSSEKHSSKERHSEKNSSKERHSKDKQNDEKKSDKKKDKHRSESEKKKEHRSSKSDTTKHDIKGSTSKSDKPDLKQKSKDVVDVPIITEKKKKLIENSDGIDAESGASFAEALGMSFPASNSSAKKTKTNNKPTYEPTKEKSKSDKSLPPLLQSSAKLNPLSSVVVSALPEISPNYVPRPAPKLLDSPYPLLSEDDALRVAMTNKNQRTKVYSGNRTFHGTVPTLYELCVFILQDNIDALEYTGGVPYEILKPVVDKATPDQLYVLENFNPYLIEDTDHLWQMHCNEKFRNQRRQELESWRETYIRCLEEREAKLRSLTANIKMAQDKSLPVRQTKMAYVDSAVKPPRAIARKQAIHGTARKAVASPAARVPALANCTVFNASTASGVGAAMPVVKSSYVKPKKAPLMQKALQFMRGRNKR